MGGASGGDRVCKEGEGGRGRREDGSGWGMMWMLEVRGGARAAGLRGAVFAEYPLVELIITKQTEKFGVDATQACIASLLKTWGLLSSVQPRSEEMEF